MTALKDNAIVSPQIFELVNLSGDGEILLVSSKGIYIQLNNQVLHLTSSYFGVTPLGIGLDNYPAVERLAPMSGHPFHLENGCFTFPNGTLVPGYKVLQATSSFPLPKADLVFSCAQALYAAAHPRSLASLCGPIFLNKPAAPSALCGLGLPLVTRLSEGIQNGASGMVSQAVSGLLGLGLGLTPSGDDVLLGFLYTLLRLAPEKTGLIKKAVSQYAPERTNSISAAYLVAVANGSSFERLDHVLAALSGQNPPDISPMLEIGSSSGSEMLLGTLLACHILT